MRVLMVVVPMLLLLSATLAFAGAPQRLKVGDVLPVMQGHDLTGRAVTIPAPGAPRPTLLILGFTRNTQADAAVSESHAPVKKAPRRLLGTK